MLNKDDELTVAMYEELLILDELREGRATNAVKAMANINNSGRLLYELQNLNSVCDLCWPCSESCPCFHTCESNQYITAEVLWDALRDENV